MLLWNEEPRLGVHMLVGRTPLVPDADVELRVRGLLLQMTWVIGRRDGPAAGSRRP